SSQLAPLRCAERLRASRRGDAGQPRVGPIKKCTGHELAGCARSNQNADGRTQIARLDLAAIARFEPTRMPATNGGRSFAGTGTPWLAAKRIEIDSGHRTRGRPIKSSIRQRARPSDAED